MASTTDNGNGTFTLTDGSHTVIVKLRSDDIAGGGVSLDCEFPDGIHVEPFRLHITNSGGRVAGDFPTCNPTYCMVDQDGHIAAG